MTAHADAPLVTQKTHEATLFFPLPDGSALLYNLFGTATPPLADQTLDIAVKAKHTQVTTILIKNWLKTQQRFKVAWKTDAEDPSLFISGANTFDIAGKQVEGAGSDVAGTGRSGAGSGLSGALD